MTVQMTGVEISAILEDALDAVFTSGSTGAYPVAAGLRYDVHIAVASSHPSSARHTPLFGMPRHRPPIAAAVAPPHYIPSSARHAARPLTAAAACVVEAPP